MPNLPLRYVDSGTVYTTVDPRVGVDPTLGALNVRSFGAYGDGVTDDTLAIQRTISAHHPQRGGIVFFPPGKYKVTSTITLDRPIILAGSGMGDHLVTGDHTSISSSAGTWDLLQQGSAIFTDSATLTAITVNYAGCTIHDLQVVNNRYPAVPTAGSGIRVVLGNSFRMQRVLVRGFYDCVTFEQSEYATVTECSIQDPVRHGLYARNLYHGDQGDLGVTNCVFGFSGWRGSLFATGAAIRLESGGGLRFVSSKINCGPPPTSAKFLRGIDVEILSITTGVLLIAASSIENTAQAIRVVGPIDNVAITGNQSSGITNGVYVDGPNRVVVTGNAFSGATVGVEIRNCNGAIVGANLGGTFVKGTGATNIQVITTTVA